MLASLTCAVHCALMPLVVSALPLFLQDEWLEWLLVGVSAGVGMSALARGYRQHRHRRALFVLATGLVLVVGGRLLEGETRTTIGVVLVVLGGLCVALAHFLNQRLSYRRI